MRVRSFLLSSINHTPFKLQLWPTLTVNALCKSNQLSSKSPTREWLNAVHTYTHTTDEFLLWPLDPEPIKAGRMQLGVANLTRRFTLTCPLFGWRAVSFGWTASSSCVFLRYHRAVEPLYISHWWDKVRCPRWSTAGEEALNIHGVHRGGKHTGDSRRVNSSSFCWWGLRVSVSAPLRRSGDAGPVSLSPSLSAVTARRFQPVHPGKCSLPTFLLLESAILVLNHHIYNPDSGNVLALWKGDNRDLIFAYK